MGRSYRIDAAKDARTPPETLFLLRDDPDNVVSNAAWAALMSRGLATLPWMSDHK